MFLCGFIFHTPIKRNRKFYFEGKSSKFRRSVCHYDFRSAETHLTLFGSLLLGLFTTRQWAHPFI